MNIRNSIVISLILLLYLIVSSIAVLCIADITPDLVAYTQILLFVVFGSIVFLQIRINGWIHLFTLFLGIFFVYMLSIPFFDMLGWINLRSISLFVPVYLSNATLIKTYTYTAFFVVILFLGVLQGSRSKSPIAAQPLEFNKFLYQMGALIFMLALPGVTTKYYLQVQLVMSKGYLAVYDGSLDKIAYPFFCHGAGTLMMLGFCFILTSFPSRKRFLLFAFLLLLTQTLNVLKGQRSVLIFPVVFVFWFYMRFYVRRTSKLAIAMGIVAVAFISQTLNYYRMRQQVADVGILEHTYNFFVQQGISFYILPNQIELSHRISSSPLHIFEVLFNEQWSFTSKFLPTLAPKMAKAGMGIGDSILTTFYDLPHVIAIILCFLMGFAITRFEMLVKSRRFLLFSSYYFVTGVLMVRYCYLTHLPLWSISVLIFFAVCSIFLHQRNLQPSYKLSL